MNIGLTYDLRDDYLAEGYSDEETAEFDSPATIDGLEEALRELGHEPDRIGNARRLVERLARGDRWSLVFNIAEGFLGLARESQTPAILDVYNIPYTFSDPFVLSLTLHKGLAKTMVRERGIATADFAVVERPTDVDAVSLPFPLFAKPVAEGTSKGISGASKIHDRQGLGRVCNELLQKFSQPVLVETYLAGREFTVGITGTDGDAQALGTLEIHLLANAEAEIYSYSNKEHYDKCVHYALVHAEADSLVAEVERLALAAWRALGCRDGGRVDIRCDAQGRPHFLEVNPLPGLNPVRSDLPILCRRLGIPYVELIGRIVHSAARRLGADNRAM